MNNMTTYVIFIGDLLVMAGVIGLGLWLFLRQETSSFDAAAHIPLDDDDAGPEQS